jgi:hypothetical protein
LDVVVQVGDAVPENREDRENREFREIGKKAVQVQGFKVQEMKTWKVNERVPQCEKITVSGLRSQR